MDTHFARCLQNVECEFCEFKVTDGPITGNFVARNTLILKTKFNAVDGSITVVSSTAAGIFSRSVIDITTTTGSINTNFTLIAVDAGTKERLSSGGAYGITTRSRNAPVRLEVVDAPVDSALKLFSKMKGPWNFTCTRPTKAGSHPKLSSEAPRWVSADTQRIRLDMKERGTWFGMDGTSRLVSNISCLVRLGGEIDPCLCSGTDQTFCSSVVFS